MGKMLYTPKHIEEIPKIIRNTADKGEKLAVRGFSTQYPCPETASELRTTNLDWLDEGTEGDLTIIAGAGCKFSYLRSALGNIAKEWPDYSGSVGGCICGDKNIPAFQFIYPRVMGISVVIADGEIIKLGSKCVKDVAGYRIFPLFFRSAGKIGIVCEVIVNCAPIHRDYSLRNSKASAGIAKNKDNLNLLDIFNPNGLFV